MSVTLFLLSCEKIGVAETGDNDAVNNRFQKQKKNVSNYSAFFHVHKSHAIMRSVLTYYRGVD